jgi:hypothetical protein
MNSRLNLAGNSKVFFVSFVFFVSLVRTFTCEFDTRPFKEDLTKLTKNTKFTKAFLLCQGDCRHDQHPIRHATVAVRDGKAEFLGFTPCVPVRIGNRDHFPGNGVFFTPEMKFALAL